MTQDIQPTTPETVNATLAWGRLRFRQEIRRYPWRKGNDGGARVAMLLNPPVYSVRTPIPPRIMLIGTTLCFPHLRQCLPEVQEKYQLINPALTNSRVTGMAFWCNFFENDDFVGNPRGNTIPSVILTSGLMRSYEENAGVTLDYLFRIEEVAAEWNIPVEVRQEH